MAGWCNPGEMPYPPSKDLVGWQFKSGCNPGYGGGVRVRKRVRVRARVRVRVRVRARARVRVRVRVSKIVKASTS